MRIIIFTALVLSSIPVLADCKWAGAVSTISNAKSSKPGVCVGPITCTSSGEAILIAACNLDPGGSCPQTADVCHMGARSLVVKPAKLTVTSNQDSGRNRTPAGSTQKSR